MYIRIGGGAGMVRKVVRLSTGGLGREVPMASRGRAPVGVSGTLSPEADATYIFFKILNYTLHAVHTIRLLDTVLDKLYAQQAHAV